MAAAGYTEPTVPLPWLTSALGITSCQCRHAQTGTEAGRCGGLLRGGGQRGEGTLSTLWGKLFSQEIMFSQTALYKAWREEGLPYMLACDDDDTMWA